MFALRKRKPWQGGTRHEVEDAQVKKGIEERGIMVGNKKVFVCFFILREWLAGCPHRLSFFERNPKGLLVRPI